MKKTAWICFLSLFPFLSAASAIQVCHDYTIYRLTCVDPRPVESKLPGGSSADDLEKVLKDMGYADHDMTNTANDNPGSLQGHLKPGDVIIVGRDHSAIVNSDGKIDHWLQDPNNIGMKRDVDKLPAGPLTSALGACAGGLFKGETFEQFWQHRCPEKRKKVVVWRSTGKRPKC
jgi:hypothetical protein